MRKLSEFYSRVITQADRRQQIIHRHRDLLIKHIALRYSEIRGLLPGQIIFLLAMHDIERFRSSSGLPASLVTYFVNNTLNKNVNLVQCMEAVAEKVHYYTTNLYFLLTANRLFGNVLLT